MSGGPGDPKDVFAPFQGIFDDLFATRRRGKDLAMEHSISLLEADRGATGAIEVTRAKLCEACKGLGADAGATRSPCTSCDGIGRARQNQGDFALETTCKACNGRGGRWDRPCAACDGVGESRETKKLEVTIPPGIADGSTLRLAGQGNELGEGRGDLHVHVVVSPHATLVRDGDHLRARVRLPEPSAKGGTLVVPWLEGSARVPMPAGARAGDELRLPGWGLTKLGQRWAAPAADGAPYRSAASSRGDLVVTLVDASSMARHYRVLGLPPTASPTEIQAAYRRLALALRPERHPENAAAPAAFARLNEAYAALQGVTSADGSATTTQPKSSDARRVATVAGVLGILFGLAYLVLR